MVLYFIKSAFVLQHTITSFKCTPNPKTHMACMRTVAAYIAYVLPRWYPVKPLLNLLHSRVPHTNILLSTFPTKAILFLHTRSWKYTCAARRDTIYVWRSLPSSRYYRCPSFVHTYNWIYVFPAIFSWPKQLSYSGRAFSPPQRIHNILLVR